MIEMNGRSREHEFIGKFYINGYGVIGLILDYDDYEKVFMVDIGTHWKKSAG